MILSKHIIFNSYSYSLINFISGYLYDNNYFTKIYNNVIGEYSRELNDKWLELNDILLDLQDPNKIKVEIIDAKIFKKVNYFFNNEWSHCSLYSNSSYKIDMHLELSTRYEKPNINDIKNYMVSYKRNKNLNKLLD